MSIADVKSSADQKMLKALDALKTSLSRIRTGRAHVGILDHIHVDYYGSSVPIGQVANITGETVKTLRYWTNLGLLSATREENQYRVYQPNVTERAAFIRNAQSLGFTLSEIFELQAACNEDCKDCMVVRDKIALQLERVRVSLGTLQNLERSLIAQLERADQNPNPDCSDTGCEFIAAIQT